MGCCMSEPLNRELEPEATMTDWVQMLVAMADGPSQPVRGVVVPYRNSDKPFRFYYGTYGEEPVFLPMRREGVRLYRWGRRSRIESMDGEVWFVSDGVAAWDFTAEPIRVPVLTDFTPGMVQLIDRDTGAFSALLGEKKHAGWLVRRPRSGEPWAVKVYGYQIAWSTAEFDWACQILRGGTLDAAGIAALHPGEPVVGTPHLVFGGSDRP